MRIAFSVDLLGGYAKYVETGEGVRCGSCGSGSIGLRLRTIADVFDFTFGFAIMERANGTTVRQRIGSHFNEVC
jgi:hypothetical protein